jgi:hypothetical protein
MQLGIVQVTSCLSAAVAVPHCQLPSGHSAPALLVTVPVALPVTSLWQCQASRLCHWHCEGLRGACSAASVARAGHATTGTVTDSGWQSVWHTDWQCLGYYTGPQKQGV